MLAEIRENKMIRFNIESGTVDENITRKTNKTLWWNIICLLMEWSVSDVVMHCMNMELGEIGALS